MGTLFTLVPETFMSKPESERRRSTSSCIFSMEQKLAKCGTCRRTSCTLIMEGSFGEPEFAPPQIGGGLLSSHHPSGSQCCAFITGALCTGPPPSACAASTSRATVALPAHKCHPHQ